MLQKVKDALRLTVNNYDSELTALIDAAVKDLTLVGIQNVSSSTTDALLVRAIITYCRSNFCADDYDKMKASYDEQKAQLISASGYGLAVS